MKPVALIFALTTALRALPVVLDSGDSPVPKRAELIHALEQAADADSAADALLIHYQANGYPATGVEVEDRGGRRFVQIEVARFGRIFLNEGPRRTKAVATSHFSRLANRHLSQPEIDATLRAFHTNPLHRAVPRLQPNDEGTRVDALLRIDDSISSQFSTGYLDTGASPLPRERFWLQGEFADLWNLNSLTSGRLTLSPDPEDFHALQLGTRFFLDDGSEIGLDLAYSGSKAPTFDAYSWQASAQWRGPETQLGSWKSRTSAGLNYRKSNNAFEFGNSTAVGFAEVFQIIAGQSFEHTWESGLTRLDASLVISPFGDDEEHQSLRPGAQAEYALIRTSIWHRQDLPGKWDFLANFRGQWSSDPVLQSEQLALGGAYGIRGLPEQSYLGDNGWIAGLELRTPVLGLPRDWGLRPSLFLQSGQVFDQVSDQHTHATTAGIGLQIGHDDSLRASIYSGWRLDEGGAETHTQLTWKF